MQARLREFLIKEWLLIVSSLGVFIASFSSGHLPVYTWHELQVLIFLGLLFVMVKGLENSGLLWRLARYMEHGRSVPLKLVCLTFFLSMLVTNDVALIVVVPLTILLRLERLDLLVILEALAANAGSALTPFGNPQNLYIYWFYHVSAIQFVASISLFCAGALLLLGFAANKLIPGQISQPKIANQPVSWHSVVYVLGLLWVILAILRIVPWWSALLTVLYVLINDRRSLRIDYFLLLSFIFLFGLADVLDHQIKKELASPERVFLFAVLTSQIISNVPATVLLAKLTGQWQALLWGVNVGGFGSLLGSFANLIAYRLYLREIPGRDVPGFTFKFIALGYAAFVMGVLLYVCWRTI